jgi:hypothetical protein
VQPSAISSSPSSSLSSSTKPPPNSSVRLNVWNSHPTLLTGIVWPAGTVALPGVKRHKGWSPVRINRSMNASKVTLPPSTHASGPRTALKVAGSRASRGEGST